MTNLARFVTDSFNALHKKWPHSAIFSPLLGRERVRGAGREAFLNGLLGSKARQKRHRTGQRGLSHACHAPYDRASGKGNPANLSPTNEKSGLACARSRGSLDARVEGDRSGTLSRPERTLMAKFLRVGVHDSNVSRYTSKAWTIGRTGSTVLLQWGSVEVRGAGPGRRIYWAGRPRQKTIRCDSERRARAYVARAIAR